MDDLAALLDTCRREAGATVAALVGRDGLLIERADSAAGAASAGGVPDGTTATATAPVAACDLPLAGAEATDLFAVADRLLLDAFAAGEAREAWLRSEGSSLHLARLAGGAFTLLVLAPSAEPARARSAVDAVRSELEAGLA